MKWHVIHCLPRSPAELLGIIIHLSSWSQNKHQSFVAFVPEIKICLGEQIPELTHTINQCYCSFSFSYEWKSEKRAKWKPKVWVSGIVNVTHQKISEPFNKEGKKVKCYELSSLHHFLAISRSVSRSFEGLFIVVYTNTAAGNQEVHYGIKTSSKCRNSRLPSRYSRKN